MKKFLLSLAAVACAASMSATTITLFDIANPGDWTGDGNGYTQTKTVDGVQVTITTNKASSTTNLLSPDNNEYAWRVYKSSSFTIETPGFNMKSMLITYDNLSNNQYALEMTLSSGWSGKLSGAEYVLSSAGLSTLTATATNGQVRIKTIVVSDSEELSGSGDGGGDNGGGTTEPSTAPDPDTIEGTITVAQALSMIEAGSTETAKVKGYITKIDEVSTSYGNATYYIADEKGGATSLEVYRGYWVDGDKFTSTNQIEVGGLIVVEGKLTNYNGTYEIGTGSKVLGYKAPEGGGGGDTPELPEGVLYMNSFETSISDWTKVNDTSIGDYAGWKVNTNSPACAIANSYYGGVNNAANARLQKNFDLSTSKNVSMSFEQAFGFIFPTSQTDNFRVYVISDGYTEYLTMSNFPPAPASGNWTKEWAINEFDLSEYDGGFITIGFEYNNPGGDTSMAWEIKNFVLYGDGALGAVEGIDADNDAAPVYYNLQGVRVDNPSKGLYIVVKGNKATKVIF